MSQLIAINEEYATWVKNIKSRFRSSQLQASLKVNQEVLRFYWQLGRDMVLMNIEKRWGEGVMKMLSQDLKEALPEVNGFSPSNLYYIKRFYVTYNQQVEILPQPGAKLPEHEETAFLPQPGVKIEGDADVLFRIPWTHHKYILDKVKGDARKGLFFVQKYIKKMQRDINYITDSLSDYRAAIVNYKIAFEPSAFAFESISDEIAIRC